MQIQLDSDIEAQLKALAAKNGRSADSYVLGIVKNYLEDIADVAKAKLVLSQNNPTYTQGEVEQEFGFVDHRRDIY